MTGIAGWQAWLTSEAPQTRAQARAVKWARLARRLLGRRLAWLGLVPLVLVLLLALAAPVLPLADPLAQDLAARLLPPSPAHWLGTDRLGRDILARVLFGAHRRRANARPDDADRILSSAVPSPPRSPCPNCSLTPSS